MNDVIAFLAINCDLEGNFGSGARLQGASTTLRFVASRLRSNGLSGMEVANSQMTTLGCLFQDNGATSGLVGNGIDINGCARGEVVGCTFSWGRPTGQPAQLIRCVGAHSMMVEGCFFEGARQGAGQPAKLGAVFSDSGWTRFAMNAGIGLLAQASPNPEDDRGLARFDSDVNDAIEYGNIELEGWSTRIVAKGQRLFGLSGGTVTLPCYLSASVLPPTTSPDLRLGAMAWVNTPETGQTQLRVLATKAGGGRVWRSVELT